MFIGHPSCLFVRTVTAPHFTLAGMQARRRDLALLNITEQQLPWMLVAYLRRSPTCSLV
ncbi:MAG: hypothetical protein ABW047_05955 [Nitrospiraceae bacterium]